MMAVLLRTWYAAATGDGLTKTLAERRATAELMMTNKTPDPTDRLDEAAGRIRSEYREMPGLCLTFEQMRRLWMLDPPTCRDVVKRLVDTQFLKITRDGQYVRCDRQGTTRRQPGRSYVASSETRPAHPRSDVKRGSVTCP
jgi:hypothetical protein